MLYLSTAAPGITWRNDGADSGELAAAVAVLGVPHPPGYPTYILFGKLATVLLPFGDTARRLTLFSAITASTAVALIVLASGLITRPRTLLDASPLLVAGLALGTAPLLWSQATITEVYAPAALGLSAAILLIAIRVMGDTKPRVTWVSGFLLGLSVGLHPTILFAAAAAVVTLLVIRVHRYELVGFGAWLAVGMSVFVMLPILAAREPAISWGDPVDLEGFLWTVTGAPYRASVFAVPWSDTPSRFLGFIGMLTREFGPVGWLLAAWGAWRAWEMRLWWFGALAGIIGGAAIVYALGYESRDFVVYLIPVLVAASLLIAVGTTWLYRATEQAIRAPAPIMAMALLLISISGLSIGRNYQRLDLTNDREAMTFAQDSASVIGNRDALVLADNDPEVFSLWYYRYVSDPAGSPRVIARYLLQFQWYRDQVRREFPGLLPDEPTNYAAAMRATLAGLPERPVYVTSGNAETSAPGYDLEPAGPLFRVIPPRGQS